MNTPLEIQPELACDACGQAGAYALGDRALCVECYAEVSSSCAGGRSLNPPALLPGVPP